MRNNPALLLSLAFGLPATISPAQAQSTPVPRVEFEVASIKPPNPKGDRGMNMNVEGDTLRMHNATLKFCIITAYAVQDSLIEGGPGWINSDTYEITAKFGNATHDQFVQMFQALLSDRFKLSVHRETRQVPVYALTLGKSGAKLHAADPGGEPFLGRRGRTGPLTGRKASMPQLASLLSMLMGRKVLDQTGLTGLYDFTLEFAPDDAVDSPFPSLVTVLQELGLKLESTKAPVEVLIIDHAEKPSPD
jgi:uncharacterized protein (TIGR03435 family)